MGRTHPTRGRSPWAGSPPPAEAGMYTRVLVEATHGEKVPGWPPKGDLVSSPISPRCLTRNFDCAASGRPRPCYGKTFATISAAAPRTRAAVAAEELGPFGRTSRLRFPRPPAATERCARGLFAWRPPYPLAGTRGPRRRNRPRASPCVSPRALWQPSMGRGLLRSLTRVQNSSPYRRWVGRTTSARLADYTLRALLVGHYRAGRRTWAIHKKTRYFGKNNRLGGKALDGR
jgi:hypothetical protein